jgi:type VI secretion system secreted protein Hcp
MALVDYFLKIEGIEGESPDAKHKGEIQLESFSWGATNSGTMAYGGGGGAGKVQFQDFHFTMKTNKAAPKLMLACATGEHIKKATLIGRKAGKEQQEYMKVEFSDLLVTSFQAGAHGGSDTIPIDQISLNFSKLEWTYKEQKPDGTLGGQTKAGYNIKENKAV